MTIDVLKMDIEGMEWEVIPNLLQTGLLRDVKQFSVELHIGRKPAELLNFLKLLRSMHEAGFRIFNTHRNIYCGKHDYGTGCNELGIVNTNFLSNRDVTIQNSTASAMGRGWLYRN